QLARACRLSRLVPPCATGYARRESMSMLARSTASLPSRTPSKTFRKIAINSHANINAAMITNLLIGSGLVAITVIIHAMGLGIVLSHVLHSSARPDTRFWPIAWLLIRIAWFLIVIHFLEIAVWALFFWWHKCLPDVESSFYFSGVTYATIGYGDLVLPKEWRLFGPVEGLTGILMCGLSTAFFFVIVSKNILQRMDDNDRNLTA